MKKITSVFGLEEKLAALVAYSLFFISGLLVLIIERENKFVRFAALQSTITFLILGLLSSAFGFLVNIWFVGLFFRAVLILLAFITFGLWIFLMITTLFRKELKLPIIGDFCHRVIYKTKKTKEDQFDKG